VTSRVEGPTTWRRAAFAHLEDAVRWAMVNDPRRPRTPRDAAFRAYLREVRATLRSDPVPFTVASRRPLLTGAASSVVEVELTGGACVEPGDMLLLWWRNLPASVDGVGSERADQTGRSSTVPLRVGARSYWTTPLPHRPSRRARTTEERFARAVADLSAPGTHAVAAPRITPRFYTVAGAVAGQVSLHVTATHAWPARAADFLHRVGERETVYAWVLRHPHRVDRTRGGLAVATGSGAAGVFAALRHGARDVRLVWGLGDKDLEPWVREELDRHVVSGALAELRLARSPQRVTDLLARDAVAVRELVADGGWLYVSGNERMGEAVDGLLTGIVGASAIARARDDLRYIVST